MDSAIWLASLEVLSFHAPFGQMCRRYADSDRKGNFNRPLDAVTFPAGLRELFLDQCTHWPHTTEISVQCTQSQKGNPISNSFPVPVCTEYGVLYLDPAGSRLPT